VRIGALRDLQIRNEPGGVCGPPPHEVVVCITQNDNPGEL
jgi:hypothetical protein